mgnify:CR=1 FL=1
MNIIKQAPVGSRARDGWIHPHDLEINDEWNENDEHKQGFDLHFLTVGDIPPNSST